MGLQDTNSTSQQTDLTTNVNGDGNFTLSSGRRMEYYDVKPNGVLIRGNRNVYNQYTDQGAVMAGIDLANAALQAGTLAVTQAQDTAAAALDGQTDLTRQSMATAADAASGGTNNGAAFILKMAALLGLLALGAAAVFGSLKKGKS